MFAQRKAAKGSARGSDQAGNTFSAAVFAKRRARIAREMRRACPDSVLVLFSAPVHLRNGDVEHEYRQSSDFFWLTGFEEPHSALVLDARGQLTMFVRPRDPEREIWDGPRAGVEGAKERYGADHAFVVSELGVQLAQQCADRRRIYHRFGRHAPDDAHVMRAIDAVRGRAREAILCPSELVDPGVLLHEARLRKDPHELRTMRRAADITSEGHTRAMREARAGLCEYQLEASLNETFLRRGAKRSAYGAIVGSGPNATILHYRSGDRPLQDGELVLIDAGCEYGYYASDVTRTFPVSGRFGKEQRALYEVVLDAQLAAIEMTRPGVTLEAIHERTVEVLVAGLRRLKLLSGSKAQILRDKSYRRFYMHRTSHWLGMDVHDVGGYVDGRRARTLEPGMVLTIEPGLYVSERDDSVPAAYRGLGVRIEDDILVTPRGHENLTAATPKTVAEVEAACRR